MKTLGEVPREMNNFLDTSSVDDTEDFLADLDDTSDLPTSLIVTNVDISVYTDSEQRTMFEDMFRQFDEGASFHYLKSFRRARVNFDSPDSAAQARIRCHQTHFGENVLNCYFAQATSFRESGAGDGHLLPPLPHRQFLISPPASPPVGWEPVDEAQPCLSYDIIAALANLTPGESHELHPPSDSQPGIVVHICEDDGSDRNKPKAIVHTACPEFGDSPPGSAATS